MNNRNHQKQEKHFIVDILFVLALFGVFAVEFITMAVSFLNIFCPVGLDSFRSFFQHAFVCS